MLVIGATNAPWDVDPAFRRPGRFGEVLFVPPPDLRARVEILKLKLTGKPIAADIDVAEIARSTELSSGADLDHVVQSAIETALAESLRGGAIRNITTADLRAAAKKRQADDARVVLDREKLRHLRQRLGPVRRSARLFEAPPLVAYKSGVAAKPPKRRISPVYMIVPVVLAAAIALGTYGFRYAAQLAEKSEQSLVESTQLLGKQTIERIDNFIVDSDRSLFELVDLDHLDGVQQALELHRPRLAGDRGGHPARRELAAPAERLRLQDQGVGATRFARCS